MVFVLVFVFFAASVGVIVYQYQARQKRVAAVAALARSIGFDFTRRDDDRMVDKPFVLFSKGSKRAVELVVSGVHDGAPLSLFDYWYYDQSADARGGRNRQYHRYTCALLTIPAACPRLQLGHENFLTRIGDHLGLKDVEFEYDDFNRRFRVKCDDQKFAFSLFDGKMMQWLLGTEGFESVEVDGPWVLLASRQLAPSQWLNLGGWLDQFHRQIPPVVYTTYPPR